jgi:hypothetical protein
VIASDPPRRRVRLSITADGDTIAHAAERLRAYLDDLEVYHGADVEPGRYAGQRGGCHYDLTLDPSAPAGPEFDAALLAWARQS